MEKERILVFGASEHTRYTIDIIERDGKYSIVGILDLTLRKGDDYEGYKILGRDEDISAIIELHKVNKGIVAIGDNFIRNKVVDKIISLSPSFSFVSAIHPSIILGKNVTIGEGTVIMAGVIINNNVSIGKHCFLATKASVDHDSYVDDYTSISAGATVGGNVKIGYCTTIALGVNIIHGRRIGSHSVVGAGALVVKDIGDNLVVYGVPAKEIRTRKNGERYL
jgi:sugar O-acyltransferase (sialic acid O-acetyltransferase NeuD family)